MYDTASIPARNATSLRVRHPADGRKILGGYGAVTLYDARDPAHEALYSLPGSWGLSGASIASMASVALIASLR